MQPTPIWINSELIGWISVIHLSELEILDDGLDLLRLAVLKVEDGALPALARRSPLGLRPRGHRGRGRRPRDLAQVGHGEVAPRRGRPATASGVRLFPA